MSRVNAKKIKKILISAKKGGHLLLKYPIRGQKAVDLSRVVVDPFGDCFEDFLGDFVEVRPFRQPPPDHFVEVFVCAALV